jgi:hypothetical protein
MGHSESASTKAQTTKGRATATFDGMVASSFDFALDE